MNLEASLVGLLINDPAAIDSVRIEPEWFEDTTYFKIVKACKETRAKGSYEDLVTFCLLYTSPSPRDRTRSRMPSSA